LQFLIKKIIHLLFPLVFGHHNPASGLYPDPYLDPNPDSLEMLDPDPDSMYPDPQLCFWGFDHQFYVCEMVKKK
jgi:hypothetical protein